MLHSRKRNGVTLCYGCSYAFCIYTVIDCYGSSNRNNLCIYRECYGYAFRKPRPSLGFLWLA